LVSSPKTAIVAPMPLPLVLSIYWFVLMGALGVFFPYYSLYLVEVVGLTGSQIGTVMATMPLVGMFAHPLWGQLADRTGSRTRVASVLALGTSAGFIVLCFAHDFTAIVAGTATMAVFMVGLIPMSVSVSMALLGRDASQRFGYVRTWGTVGFLVSVYSVRKGLPLLSTLAAPDPPLALILPLAAVLYLAAAVLTLALPRDGAVSVRAGRGDWKLLIGNKPFVRFLMFIFGIYVCQQGPMALFPLLVAERGGSVEMLADMWVLMLLLEIPLIALSGAGLTHLGARGLLAAGALSGGLRWLVTGAADDLRIVYAVQILHGITVTGIIVGASLYVELVVPERLRSTGQSLVSMVGISLAGALSNLGSGALTDAYGATAPALVGGVGGLVLACAIPWLVDKTSPIEHADATPHLAPTDTGAIP
jgi:PPP family 3-phenylpropionic acid transporter